MFISKMKLKSFEKRIADLERSIQSQQSIDELCKVIGKSVHNAVKACFSEGQVHSKILIPEDKDAAYLKGNSIPTQ